MLRYIKRAMCGAVVTACAKRLKCFILLLFGGMRQRDAAALVQCTNILLDTAPPAS